MKWTCSESHSLARTRYIKQNKAQCLWLIGLRNKCSPWHYLSKANLKSPVCLCLAKSKKWAPWSGAGRCGAGEGRSPDKRSALRQESSDMVNQSHCSRYSPVSEAYIPLRTMITSPPDQSIRQRQKRSAYRLDNGQRNIFGSNGFSCRMPSFSKLSLGQFTVYLRGSVSPPKY